MINKKEKKYREKVQTQDIFLSDDEFLKKYYGTNRFLLPFLITKGFKFQGSILELGAGSCWLTGELSMTSEVKKIYAMDISKKLYEKIGRKTLSLLKADTSKINFIEGDMHEIKFPDNYFDFVMFSAALHHSISPEKVLKECFRVLKKNGKLFALNEPVAPSLCLYKNKRLIFGKEKIRKAIWNEPENWGKAIHIYTKEEWSKIFRQSGFALQILPYLLGLSLSGKIVKYSPLRFLNGTMFFSLFQMVAKKS